MTAVLFAVLALLQAADFQLYRTQVEPVFLKVREANGPGGSCFGCHTHINTRLRLEPLGSSLTWTEEQSRKNYEAVKRLIVPGDPARSRLLLHPLAIEAGGDAVHAGGKHWPNRNDPEYLAIAAWVRATPAPALPPTTPGLDYEIFRTRVQAVLLDKREGFARCYVCHSQGTNFRLQMLNEGSTTWTEEQSRRNFDAIQRLVVPGDPSTSRLLMMPLAEEAGGDPFHPGGKRWKSKDDPEWQMLSAWVRGSAR
jgi:hypothetical protein